MGSEEESVGAATATAAGGGGRGSIAPGSVKKTARDEGR